MAEVGRRRGWRHLAVAFPREYLCSNFLVLWIGSGEGLCLAWGTEFDYGYFKIPLGAYWAARVQGRRTLGILFTLMWAQSVECSVFDAACARV